MNEKAYVIERESDNEKQLMAAYQKVMAGGNLSD